MTRVQHLTNMLLGILGRCDSMTEICESQRAFEDLDFITIVQLKFWLVYII